MAAKKKSPDAQKVERFLDDIRQNMHDHTPPVPAQPDFKAFLASLGGLLVQAIIFGAAGGVALRIVRFIAGF